MSFSKTYNITQSLAAFPCAQPDPVIMALTFLPAVAPALMEWVSFGCRDILKFRLGKGAPCGRAMKAQVAKAIPPKWVDTVSKVMKWEHRFSYAGQMFLLADLASDTVARWSTLAYQLSGCPDANNIKTWDIEPSGPAGLLPGVPTSVGGVIRNEQGPPGIAFPTGAVVPSGWYLQAHFEVKATARATGQSTGLTTWLRRTSGGGYDYPGNHYTPGYFNTATIGYVTMETQNTDPTGSAAYAMYAMADELAFATEVKGHFSASPFPTSDWALSPMGCLRDLGVEHVPNPANRNARARSPSIVPNFIADFLPKPVHGPPGGMPRSKN